MVKFELFGDTVVYNCIMVDHKRKNVTSELKKKITSMESKNKKKKNNWRKEKKSMLKAQ